MTQSQSMVECIRENPDVLRRTLDNNEAAVESLVARVREAGLHRIVVAANGSSYTASLMAAPLLRCYSSLPVYILPPSLRRLIGVPHFEQGWPVLR